MKYLLAITIIFHGFAHLVGFVVSWGLAVVDEMPYKTTLLHGRVDIGHAGIRLIGVLWLLTALTFFLIGSGIVGGYSWWRGLLVWTAAFSSLLCILGWPDARLGFVINIVILIAMAAYHFLLIG